jgi:hypothetical protein
VFHTDVAEVDRDVVYVAMVVHVCCKHLSSMFHLFFFIRMLQVCLSKCYICFTHMLQVFLSGCCVCLQWFSIVFCKCFR